jgi:4-coumarate--CoA ligase
MNRKGEIFVLDRIKVRLDITFAGSSLIVLHQEMLKVRGFQVAPAELEGCILDHSDVADTCVVGVPDEYSGERPLAFVVLRSDAVSRIQHDPAAAEAIKQSIMKVDIISFPTFAIADAVAPCSMLQTTKSDTRGWLEGSSL